MERSKSRSVLDIFALVIAVLMVYLIVLSGLGLSLTAHSPYDSYTLQAMSWREGRTTVDQATHSWLELALFDNEYYVSFPPFPSVVMLPLTWIHGEKTPTLLVNLIMLLMTAGFGFALLERMGIERGKAAVLAFFYVCGCNLWIIMLRGGVWYTAQGMSMLLTTIFFFGVTERPGRPGNRDGAEGTGRPGNREWAETPGRWGSGGMAAGLICIALAVGCRPFQAIYVPYGLYQLYRFRHRQGEGFFSTCLRMIPFVIVPLIIAGAYGWYNALRFGNPLEFGHNYLPEFTREGNTQFSTAHWLHNLQNILRMPKLVNGVLTFEMLGPSALVLLNPMYVISLLETIRRLWRREMAAEDWILTVSLMIHFNLLLLHRTLGGMQLGTRYMIDLMPAMLALTWRKGRKLYRTDALLMLLGIAMNIYGSIVFFK